MASDPAKTFHRFPYLPFELREMIWKLAIRPLTVPNAHFLTIFKPPKSVPKGYATFVHGRAKKNTPILAAPLYNNSSAYMIDWGLWTACKDSRRIIQQSFAKGNGFRQALTVKGRFIDNGQNRYFIRFITDLVCFQHVDLRNILHWTTNSGFLTPDYLWGLSNVAFEYNKRWGDLFVEELPVVPYKDRRTMDGIIFRTCHRIRASRFWVIDYRARPKTSTFEEDTSYREFHVDGKRFVSALDDDGWDFQGSSSWIFVQRLMQAIEAWEESNSDESNSDDGDFNWRCPVYVGVLAYIE